jgi:hypothetical protein
LLIRNKLILVKRLSPESFERLPYWEFKLLVDEWVKEIKQEERRNKEQEAQMKRNQSKFKPSKFKTPRKPKMK